MTLRPALRAARARARLLRSCERGVTLTELLVSMTLLAIVMTALVTLFTSGLNSEAQLNFRFQSQSEARVALDSMRRDIHNACAATVTGGTQVTLLVVDGTKPSYPCTLTSASWCTSGSGSRYGLYRAAGSATCSNANVRRADYLTAGTIFTLVPGTTELPKVGVDFTVNMRPSVARLKYRLNDEIALRNARRT